MAKAKKATVVDNKPVEPEWFDVLKDKQVASLTIRATAEDVALSDGCHWVVEICAEGGFGVATRHQNVKHAFNAALAALRV